MDKLITRKEAASILGISVKTLDAARTDGLISYVQYVENGCVYFTEVGIQEYIAKCILHHPEGVDLMPADIQLSGMEVSLVNAMSRETILRKNLQPSFPRNIWRTPKPICSLPSRSS